MTLDPHTLRSQVINHQGLDLDAARRVTYVIEQSFRYEYDAPVRSLRQRLVIVPPPGTAASTAGRTSSRWPARRPAASSAATGTATWSPGCAPSTWRRRWSSG